MDTMVHDYTIPNIDVARNAFVRNCNWKGTCDEGLLYPIFWDETLPGDTKQLNATVFGRLSTPFVPVLDNIYLDVHFFYCPLRILWDNAKKFFGERKNPTDSIDFMTPTLTADSTNGFARYGLCDYLGIPPAVPSLTISSGVFYLRAYNKIWNEWYRSEILQNSVTELTGDTGDTESIYNLLPRGKRQDYFTSGFTSTQKGAGTGVNLPLGTEAPVIFNKANSDRYFRQQFLSSPAVFDSNGDPYGSAGAGKTKILNVNNSISQLTVGTADTLSGSSTDGFGYFSAYADLTSATSATINSLRQAIALQQFLERDMYAGSRYRELILSHYGVTVPDYTVQVPEYLGGGTVRVNVSPIAQTSSTDSTTPQGNLAAIGTVAGSDIGFTHSFDEHGVILGLASFRTDLNYQQGLDRHFSRNTRYDYFFPCLAHLGMQSVLNKEIYAQGDGVKDSNNVVIDNKVFNYNMRYDEYRFKNSYVTGKFRSTDPQSLDVWHLAEKFNSLPTFNNDFIKVSDTVNRVVAVQSEPEFLLDAYFDFTDVREVPMYGTPGLTRI